MDGCFVDATIMTIERLETWAVTFVQCLVGRKKSEEHRRKEYAVIYRAIIDTATNQLVWTVKEFVNHLSRKLVTEERLGLSSL